MTLEQTLDKTFGDFPEDRNVMAVMGTDGDTKTSWDPRNSAEVAAARAQFELLVGEKKYAAFRMNGEDRGEQMREFDPNARRILFAPPMQGG